MRRLKSILTPPASAGHGTRAVSVVAGVALLGLAGAGSIAVAAQRAPQITPDTDVAMPLATSEHAYLDAAMTPIFKAAWPGACGFGSGGPNGRVFVHSGEGCPTLAGPRIFIQTLAGVSPSSDPRAAFEAVKSACDAGRPIQIAFSQGERSETKAVACASAPVAPPPPVRFTADIAYDPAISIAAGDRLEITLKRDVEGGGTASTGMVLDLAPGAMPGLAFAELRPPLLPADRRNGPMFQMTARIVGSGGEVKAVSDRDLGRNHAPYVNTATAIGTRLQMVPIEASSIPPQQAQTAAGVSYLEADAIEQVSEEAQAALPQPTAGTGRLWLSLDASGFAPMPGDKLVVSIRGEAGDRYLLKTSAHAISSGGVPARVALDLAPDYFPTLGEPNRTYVLEARVEREGRTAHSAAPATLRLAAGSQRSLNQMQPVMTLSPTAR